MSQNLLQQYLYCPNCRLALKEQLIDNEARKLCNSCGFIFWNNPKPVVSVVHYKNNSVLMLQRAHEPFKGFWVLPGGFMGYSETAQEAAKREVKEETGMSVLIEKIIGVYRIDSDPRGVHIDIIFAAKPTAQPSMSTEDIKWDYFSTNNLPQKIVYKHREAITDWVKQK